MAPSMNQRRRILIGQIGPPHGVRGDVFVHSYAAVPEDIATYGPLTDTSGNRQLTIKALKTAGQRLVARFDTIGTREAAEALRGLQLYIDRSQLPEAAPGEWYQADLVGLSVVDLSGTTLGRVAAIVNFGAGDLVEIQPAAGGDTVLLPFTDDYVPTIDVAGGQLVVVMPVDDDPADEDQHEPPAPPKE
jgi:16S rRNA processing protein RimM